MRSQLEESATHRLLSALRHSGHTIERVVAIFQIVRDLTTQATMVQLHRKTAECNSTENHTLVVNL